MTDMNDEYYRQKYMKYKAKYINLKLDGGNGNGDEYVSTGQPKLHIPDEFVPKRAPPPAQPVQQPPPPPYPVHRQPASAATPVTGPSDAEQKKIQDLQKHFVNIFAEFDKLITFMRECTTDVQGFTVNKELKNQQQFFAHLHDMNNRLFIQLLIPYNKIKNIPSGTPDTKDKFNWLYSNHYIPIIDSILKAIYDTSIEFKRAKFGSYYYVSDPNTNKYRQNPFCVMTHINRMMPKLLEELKSVQKIIKQGNQPIQAMIQNCETIITINDRNKIKIKKFSDIFIKSQNLQSPTRSQSPSFVQ